METNHPSLSSSQGAPGADWAAIELAYTTTRAATREIGAAHGVSHTAINKRAKANGWIRPGKQLAEAKAQLEPRQRRFVSEYLIDLNGTQAAIRAGYSATSAAEQAYDLLRKPQIKSEIEKAQKKLQDELQLDAKKVAQNLALIASADPRELVEVKTGCCRHCFGEGNRYQRTVGEMNADRELWAVKGNAPADFDEQGGIGFNPLLEPSPDCPQCGGDGHSRVVIKDTRKLSPQARALYAGAKEGKYGIEVQMHSQMEAWEKLGKHLGLYAKDNFQRSDPLSLRDMSDAERAMRMQRVLTANPELMATLGQMLGGGGAQ